MKKFSRFKRLVIPSQGTKFLRVRPDKARVSGFAQTEQLMAEASEALAAERDLYSTALCAVFDQ
jgi:hypothetical protein